MQDMLSQLGSVKLTHVPTRIDLIILNVKTGDLSNRFNLYFGPNRLVNQSNRRQGITIHLYCCLMKLS